VEVEEGRRGDPGRGGTPNLWETLVQDPNPRFTLAKSDFLSEKKTPWRCNIRLLLEYIKGMRGKYRDGATGRTGGRSL
jgi:hypothetical protein